MTEHTCPQCGQVWDDKDVGRLKRWIRNNLIWQWRQALPDKPEDCCNDCLKRAANVALGRFEDVVSDMG